MSLCYSIVKMMEDLQSNVVFIALCFKQMSLQNLVDGIHELMKYFKKKNELCILHGITKWWKAY